MVAGEPLRRVGAPTPRLLRSPPLAKVQSHSHHLLRRTRKAGVRFYFIFHICGESTCLIYDYVSPPRPSDRCRIRIPFVAGSMHTSGLHTHLRLTSLGPSETARGGPGL